MLLVKECDYCGAHSYLLGQPNPGMTWKQMRDSYIEYKAQEYTCRDCEGEQENNE